MLIYIKIEREGAHIGKPYLLFKTKLQKIIECRISQSGNKKTGMLYSMTVELNSKQ